MPVQLNGGRSLHIHARFNWPVWTSLAEAVSQAPTGVPTDTGLGASAGVEPAAKPTGARNERVGSGLAQLRTGDEQMASLIDKIRRVLDRDIPPARLACASPMHRAPCAAPTACTWGKRLTTTR